MNEVPTSQFSGKPKRAKLDGRKARRKKFTVTVLPPRKARGRMKEAFNRPMHADRQPIMGDKIVTTEGAYWLRHGRGR